MNSARRALAVLVAILALGVAPVAYAGVDYSKNAAGGDYAPAVAAPADTPQAASNDSGFAWGAAALGAGAALVLVLVVTRVRSGHFIVRPRREPA